MNVRIGIKQGLREIEVEVPDADRESLLSLVRDALSGKSDVLELQDRRGKSFIIPAARINYVEIDPAQPERRVGFAP